MIAATEVGAAPLPKLLQAYEAHWLWFAVWGGDFIDNAEWNSAEALKEVRHFILYYEDSTDSSSQIYASDYVLTLDEIQGWRGQ
jgi:mannan endo-1,4-beta-mannosidase